MSVRNRSMPCNRTHVGRSFTRSGERGAVVCRMCKTGENPTPTQSLERGTALFSLAGRRFHTERMVQQHARRHGAKTRRDRRRTDPRADILRRVDELSAVADELDTMTDTPAVVAEARQLLDHTRRELSGHPLRELLRPAEIEALCGVDAAELELVRAAPEHRIVAALPDIARRIQAELRPDDARRRDLESLLARANARPPLRETVLAALGAANLQRRRALTRMGIRTWYTRTAAAALALAAMVLALAGALQPDGVLAVCYDAAGPACPTGPAPTSWDLTVVGAAGALGASLMTWVSTRKLRSVRMPVSLAWLSAGLRLPLGALTAAAGLLMIARGRVPGLSALDTQWQILSWGVYFGILPQMFVVNFDRRLLELAERTQRWYDSAIRPLSTADASTTLTPRPLPVHRYRLMTLVVTVVSVLIAFAPLVPLLGRWTVPAVAVLAAAAYASRGVARAPKHRVLRRPLPIIRTAVSGALRPMWTAAALTLTVHVTGTVIIALGNALSGGRLAGGLVSGLFTAPLAAVLALMATRRVRVDLGRLLSGEPGPRVSRRSMRRVDVRVLVAVGGPSVAALVVASATGLLAPSDVAALLAMAGIGLVLSRRQLVKAPLPRRGDDVLHAQVESVLTGMGYRVTPRPQLGAPEVDCLLDQLDLMASRDDLALAVQIHTSRPEDGTNWTAASELLIATKALKQHLRHQEPITVKPVMVLVDSAPDDSLVNLADLRSVELIQTSRATAQRLGTQLSEMVSRLRGPRPAAQG
jgi:hypothetical protein